ncbi:hypothetical protein H5410_050381 [Solanum commersonii]|uniref:MADS-box domain-containing protein n=1 Tax=Solanum commersonii TaxID=4109 RepID=A0A9J5WVC6_SOLCO|nr:hypothetical protein H5410_050381 [Solanum commersonii]
MEHKKTAGCQKIPLAKIENESARFTTFSKRRPGLYKNLVNFPTSNVVIDRFINPTTKLNASDRLVVVKARKKVSQFNDILNELDETKKIANEKLDRMNEARDIGWWESKDRFSVHDTMKFEAWLTSSEFNLNEHLEQLENGASSSSHIPSDDANISPNVF